MSSLKVAKVNEIIDIYNKGKLLQSKNQCNIDNFSIQDKIYICEKLLVDITNGIVINKDSCLKNYKMEYYYSLCEYIVDNIINFYSPTQDYDYMYRQLLDSVFHKISGLYKGHILLKKLIHIIKLSKLDVRRYLITASKSGTIVTFEFWLKLSIEKEITKLAIDNQHEIFINSIANSDDRLYKSLLKNILSNNKLFLQQNGSMIRDMIRKLGSSLIPDKYILKRLRILSEYISLTPYFNDMILSFNTKKVLLEIHKYYYFVPYTFKLMLTLVSKIKYDDLEFHIDIFKTDEEKKLFNIVSMLIDVKKNNINFEDNIIINIIKNNSDEILNLYIFSSTIDINIIKILSSYGLINSYIQKNIKQIYNPTLLLFSKFLDVGYHPKNIPIYKKAIAINFMLHRMRILAKHKKRNTMVNHSVKMFNVLNEIKTYEPKSDINVLKMGSNLYQLNKQKFTNLPPRHLLSGELYLYKNFLLREKADGILINNMPVNIYPKSSLLNNYQIKAEYIEELDLYLVFDIDIPNTTIIERYNILQNEHTYTNSRKLQTIDSFDDYTNILKLEHVNIMKFMNENTKELVKWYPKFACMYIDSHQIYKQLIQNVILNKNYDMYDTIYKSDGIILSPLDGNREIKIKPINYMTIDLLYSNNQWLDRNNYDWSDIVNTKSVKNGSIYRLIPNNSGDKLTFDIGSYRYDKKHPNPHNIVDIIINLIKYDWNDDIKSFETNKTFYYGTPKNIFGNILKSIKIQSIILEEQVSLLNPQSNRCWLDLGCGSGKLVNIINKHNPMYYVGLDADIKQLVKAIKYHDMNQNVYHFNPCNLGLEWNTMEPKWNNMTKLLNKKFDYIVANFSLMHFFNDIFWSQLDNVVNMETVFLFNLVNPTNDMIEWNEMKSFLKVSPSKVNYYFEWTHDNTMEEPYINYDTLISYLKKYGWTIINKFNPTNNKLASMYTWFIVKRLHTM